MAPFIMFIKIDHIDPIAFLILKKMLSFGSAIYLFYIKLNHVCASVEYFCHISTNII